MEEALDSRKSNNISEIGELLIYSYVHFLVLPGVMCVMWLPT